MVEEKQMNPYTQYCLCLTYIYLQDFDYDKAAMVFELDVVTGDVQRFIWE